MPITDRAKILVLAATLSVAAGCTPAHKTDVVHDLDDTSWKGVRIAGDAVPPGIAITLTFEADGRLHGLAGCNRYMGRFEAHESRIVLGQIGATKMLCPQLHMVAERRYITALEHVRGWRMKDGRLYLVGGGAELTFEPGG